MSTNTKRISWGVVLSAITFVTGMQTKGCLTYAAMSDRVKAVEVREEQHSKEYDQLRQDLGEINRDVKHLLERGR